MLRVEIQIQLQDIEARLSQHTELSCHGVLGNECAQLSLAHVARARDSGDLEFGGGRGNVGVEA